MVPRHQRRGPYGDFQDACRGMARRSRALRHLARGGRRNLQLALHRKPHQGTGRLPVRLGLGREAPGRRIGQARHHRRETGLGEVREGDPQSLGRLARRGAPHGPDRRPAVPLGRRAGRQQDLRLRHREGPGQAAPGEDHRRSAGQDRLRGAAHLLRAARPHAGAGAVQLQGPRRRDGDGRLQHQG